MLTSKAPAKRMAVVAAALILAGCGRDAPVAFNQPLRRMARVETKTQALQEWARIKARADVLVHICGSDDLAVFAPELAQTMRNAADQLASGNVDAIGPITALIENGGTVNLGQRAGLYRRVIWVMPSAGPATGMPLEEFRKAWAAERRYPEAELADFTAVGKHFQGTIDGIPVTVTALEDLETGEERAILNIDLTYFVGLQGRDPSHRPGTASLLDILRVLRDRRIRTDCVTINQLSIHGLVPMDIRFYGEIIGEVLENPALLGYPPPAVYARMIEAEKALVAGGFDQAEALYAELAALRGGSAGLYFSLAVARGFLDRAEDCRQAMLQAYVLDPAYLRGFFQLARVLGGAGRVETGRHLLGTPDLANIVAPLELDQQHGMFYFGAGRYVEAIARLERVAALRRDDFAVRTVLLRAYEEVGDDDKLMGVLEALLGIDSARVERDMPWLYKRIGDLAGKQGMPQRAAEAYSRYLQLVPGDEDEAAMKALIERERGR